MRSTYRSRSSDARENATELAEGAGRSRPLDRDRRNTIGIFVAGTRTGLYAEVEARGGRLRSRVGALARLFRGGSRGQRRVAHALRSVAHDERRGRR